MMQANAQGNRVGQTTPVLHFQPPKNFMRGPVYPPEDYLSTQYNGSIQIYSFEPFSGNIVEAFHRTLLRDRIDARYREENVPSPPQFGQLQLPGADAVFFANFYDNTVGIPKPHLRILILSSRSAAIVDASAINTSLWPRLMPELNGMLSTLRVDSGGAPPSLSEEPSRAGLNMAGLYQGIKAKFMTGLTFQNSYYIQAKHFYLFSASGLVFRAYDQIPAYGGDINHFNFEAALHADPQNCGRYTLRDEKLYLQMGNNPMTVIEAPTGNTVTIDSVVYTRR